MENYLTMDKCNFTNMKTNCSNSIKFLFILNVFSMGLWILLNLSEIMNQSVLDYYWRPWITERMSVLVYDFSAALNHDPMARKHTQKHRSRVCMLELLTTKPISNDVNIYRWSIKTLCDHLPLFSMGNCLISN